MEKIIIEEAEEISNFLQNFIDGMRIENWTP
jgi:hypothetical protein